MRLVNERRRDVNAEPFRRIGGSAHQTSKPIVYH